MTLREWALVKRYKRIGTADHVLLNVFRSNRLHHSEYQHRDHRVGSLREDILNWFTVRESPIDTGYPVLDCSPPCFEVTEREEILKPR